MPTARLTLSPGYLLCGRYFADTLLSVDTSEMSPALADIIRRLVAVYEPERVYRGARSHPVPRTARSAPVTDHAAGPRAHKRVDLAEAPDGV